MRPPRWVATGALALAACASPPAPATRPGEGEEPEAPLAVDVRFEGNEALSASSLREAIEANLEAFARRGGAKAWIDDAAFDLEAFYLREGFPFPSVRYEVEAPSEASRRVLFRIREGPRTVLDEVRFEGNVAFPAEELRAYLVSRRGGLFGTGAAHYVRSDLESAARAIEGHYVQRGYLDVEVVVPEALFRDDRRRAAATFAIREGVQYRIAEVRLSGELGAEEEAVREASGLVRGDPYLPRLGFEGRARLLEFYGDRGHPDAAVALEETRDPATGDVALAYRIEPGPLVTISEVRVEGNVSTGDSFVRSRLKARAGETYGTKAVRDSFRALFRTGLFESVDLQLEGEGAERPLVVRVRESPSIELFVEPGWGSYELARVRAGFRERNLFGTGRLFRSEVTGAVRAQEATIGVTDPWFLGSDVRADFPIFFRRREEPSFIRLEWGGRARFQKSWTDEFETTFGYELRRSEAKDVDVVDPVVLAEIDEIGISAVSFSPGYDSRDDVFVPRRGLSAKGTIEWGDGVLGSELDFLRAQLAQSVFLPITGSTTLGASVRGGVIVPVHDSEEIPIQERYFNGGEGTVRSFRQDELGPKDADGNPIGGEGFTILSFELRQGLFDRLEAAVFYDAGNVVPDHADYFDFDGFRAGVGGGLRYLLPIGPVRLDAAWNPNPRDGEDRYVIHFSVGMAF